jgi:Domain of unknown function (DUF5916)/Carbohydrate family 9 binding domain-like
MKKHLYILAFLPSLFLTFLLSAQTNEIKQPIVNKNIRIYQTNRIAHAPSIDGVLDDECWKTATVAKNFIQRTPKFGGPAEEPTEVRMVYDDQAVYIGAYLFDSQADKIQTNISLRDELGRADRFELGMDTYDDNINGFKLIVSAANVQFDGRHLQNDFDPSWDGIWASKVKINKDGWCVEIKVPYSTLRFPKKDIQTWGVQFVRVLARAGELSTWSPVNPNIDGIVNQWGELQGLKGIKPPLRLALFPYLAGYANSNPIDDKFAKSYSYNGGLDVKYGINESFTLDATLIPDFGQVQSDNVVRNLSPFDVQYEERRPFFTEGTELFSRGGVFYSRRIGGRPSGYFAAVNSLEKDEEMLNNPNQTQLYNATKISGRTSKNLGIGILNAIAAPVYADIRDTLTGKKRRFQTGVLSNYNVAVIDQILPNYSSISFTNTNVTRQGDARDANVSVLRFNVRDKKNRYDFRMKGGFSKIQDKNLSDSLQLGGGLEALLSKVSGKWRWDIAHSQKGKNLNINDLGYQQEINSIQNGATLKYYDYDPKGKRQNWENELSITYVQRQQPRTYQEWVIEGRSQITFKDFNSISFETFNKPAWYYDFFEPRTPGRKFYHAPFAYGGLTYQTDNRKPYNISVGFHLGESPIKRDAYVGGNIFAQLNFNTHFKSTLNFELNKDYGNFGFVTKTSDQDITFGFREVTTVSNTLSMTYAFNSTMNINWRVRQYWNKLNYLKFFDLQNDGTVKEKPFVNTFDENFNAFNSDFVFTWQFAPGSFFNIIWKNGVLGGDLLGQDSYFQNLRKVYNAPKNNSIAIKAIYYLDWNSLRKKAK